tara:strand:- start:16578 stop:17780 length:1203 start_codon:yes stop_codon:yes gene_type:complete
MVPEEWRLIALENISETAAPIRYGVVQIGENIVDGIPIVPIKYINSIATSRLHRASKGIEQKYANSRVQGGDVLISVKGTIGAVGIVPNGFLGNIAREIARIRPSKEYDSTYIALQLLAEKTQREIDNLTVGTTRREFSIHTLRKFAIPVPPLPEQKKIAKILSTWDKAITATEQLLANSHQQKKALMQQLLTGKKRLLDNNGLRFSGRWSDIRLKTVLREEKSRNKSNSIERVLSVTNHSGFVLPEDQFSKRVASDDVSNYKVVKRGQYGYNPSRLNVGSFARLDSYEAGLLSPMYVVFSVNEKLLSSDYFMNWMSSNEAMQRISGSTQGSVRDSVGFDALCGFPFRLPPMDEQQKIAAVLSVADQEITTLQQKLHALKLEKKALMQQLLTGKRRVSLN